MSVPSSSAQDVPPGVHGCSGKCDCCSYMKDDIDQFHSTSTGKIYGISQSLNCKMSNVIYVIECKKCHAQFVGKTASTLKARFSKVKNSIIKKEFRLLSHHFNNNGHALRDLMIFPIEHVSDTKQLKEREVHWREQVEVPLQGRPLAQDRDTDELIHEEPEEGRSSDPQVQSAAVTPKRKQSGGNSNTPSKKRRKEKKRQSVFSQETERCLSACEDAISDARCVISEISKKLENVFCQTSESKEFLENLRQKTMDLKAQKPFEKIYIGLFGRTGAGKSSLMNAIVAKDIVPSGSGQACTSVCVQVEANTENDKYKAEIEFISKEDWESELHYLLEVLSRGTKADNGDEDSEFKEIAQEKIRALYGEKGLDKNFDSLVENKKVAEIVAKCRKILSFATAEELYENISCYIRSDKDTEQVFWPLVKCVTIYVPDCPALPEGVVLVDLPGAGDANRQRDEMWKERINKCASVWIINDIDRALSDKEGKNIFESSLRTIGGGGECHNITFVCTKTDNIDVTETKRNYKITDKDLGISDGLDENSSDYESVEKQACIRYHNNKIREKFKKQFKLQVEDMLLGESDDSDSYFSVFTVSSKQYKIVLKRRKSALEPEDTELPSLMEHIKKLYVSHFEKKVKDYLIHVSGVVSFLNLCKSPSNAKLQHFCSAEFYRLEKDLTTYCQKMEKCLTEVERKLQTALDEGVKEAEKCFLGNARKILEPAGKDYRGYHKTLKAMCRNSGYYRSSNGDVIDLNYTLSKPMYAKINEMFVKAFSPKNLRSSIKAQLESFEENFIKGLSKDYKKEPEKYMRLVYIKTEQRKLLNNVEQEILQRKKRIYDSVSLSVQETLKPVYTELGAADKYNVTDILEKLNNTIESFKHVMFRQAKSEMLRLFNELKNWTVKEIKMQMTSAMRLALQQTPDDFVNLPDVGEEYEAIKRSCESLDIKIFV